MASHGYEDDADQGEVLYYTGAGGRDLSGNKRTSEQCKDQEWESSNLALAHNCAVKFNPKGGDAGDNWRKGVPIRVVRGNKGKAKKAKGAKGTKGTKGKRGRAAKAGGATDASDSTDVPDASDSTEAPDATEAPDFQPPIPDLPNVKQIFRYDGIYKVVKYWREKGSSGHLVCRYQLRRDDPVPAPWTPEGAALIKSKGLSFKLPSGKHHTVRSPSFTSPAEP